MSSSPTPKARANLLQKSEKQFRTSNQSAYSIDSIAPSQLSSSTNQRHTFEDAGQQSLEYRPLSFENILFMSKVYTRNAKKMMMKKIFNVKDHSKSQMAIQAVPSWEAIRNELDAESLLLSSEDGSTKDDEFGYLIRSDNSPTPFFEQLLLEIANYIVSACFLTLQSYVKET